MTWKLEGESERMPLNVGNKTMGGWLCAIGGRKHIEGVRN